MRIPIAKKLSTRIPLRSLLLAVGIFSLLIFSSRNSLAQEQSWLSYFPSVVRLQGKLTKVLKYGPSSD